MNQATTRKWLLIVLAFGLPATLASQTGGVTVLAVDSYGDVVPGATVTLTPPSGGAPVFATTGVSGFADFDKVQVASGDYTLKVEAPGFASETRTFKVTTVSRVTRNIVLQASVVDETILVAVVDAAAGLPPWVEGSQPSAGSLATLYGVKIGPETLGYNVLPLEGSIAGFSFLASQGTQSLTSFPIYAQTNQSTVIMPSGLEVGPATLKVSGPAGEVASIDLLVDAGVPQPFATGGAGLGLGAITHVDGAPITFNHPANFGETVIGYYSKTGRRPDDTLFFAQDLRSRSNDAFFHHLFDGNRLPDESLFFLGTSGIGTGQSNFKIPDSPLPGSIGYNCGTTIETVMLTQAGTSLRSNPVLLPISSGGPCNDSTGLGELIKFLDQDGLKLFRVEVTEATSYLLDRDSGKVLSGPQDTFEVSNRLRQFDDFNYYPFPNSGACTREWRPQGYGGAGLELDANGNFQYTLEGTAQDNVDANSTKVYSRPTKGIPSGELGLTIKPSLVVSGTGFNSTISTPLHRDGDFYNLLLNHTSQATVSRPHDEIGELVEDILPVLGKLPQPAGRDTFAVFRTVADFGDLGSLTVTCGMSLADLASKAISADNIVILYKDNATAQKLTIPSAQPERITAVLTVYQDRVPIETTGAVNGVLASLKTEFRWFWQ